MYFDKYKYEKINFENVAVILLLIVFTTVHKNKSYVALNVKLFVP